MVDTIKFSEFTNGGDISNDTITVGIGGGDNIRYNNPWVFYPPGTTAERPEAPDIGRLRFNTDVFLYEYWDTVEWIQLTINVGVTSITGTADQVLANGTTGTPETSAVTLTLPQDIGTTSTPLFAGMTLTNPLEITYGGTGITSFTAGDIPYYTSGDGLSKLPIGTVDFVLTSSGTAPEWTDFASVALTSIDFGTTGLTPNTPTGGAVEVAGILVAEHGGTGVDNGSSTITVGGDVEFSGAFTFEGTLTGNTSVTFPTSGTLATTGGTMNYVADATGTIAMAVNTGYVCAAAGLTTATLPATAAVGDRVGIVAQGAGGWTIAQNAGQTIHVVGTSTTTGVGGSLASVGADDNVELVCTVANTDWKAFPPASAGLTIV